MRYQAYFVALLLLCIPLAAASAASMSNINMSELNAAFIKQAYNDSIGSFPDSYKSLIGDNRIAIRLISENNGVTDMGLVTTNGQLSEAVDGTLKNPSIEIVVKENALKDLQTAQDPVEAFNKAISNKDISVKGNGFVNQIKVNVLLGNPLLPELLIKLLTPPNSTLAAA